MKNYARRMVLIGASVIIPLVTTAQVSIGIHGGPLFSRPTLGQTEASSHLSVQTTNGFSLGAVVQIQLTERVALVFEPGFVRKGLDLVPEPNNLLAELAFGLDYVELPVNLKMTFLRGTVQPFVTAGSAVAYKVAERPTITVGSTQQTSGFPEVFSRYDVTAALGGGVSFAMLDPISFLVDGRYSFGLNYMEKTGSGRFRSAEWRLGAGMMLAL